MGQKVFNGTCVTWLLCRRTVSSQVIVSQQAVFSTIFASRRVILFSVALISFWRLGAISASVC